MPLLTTLSHSILSRTETSVTFSWVLSLSPFEAKKKVKYLYHSEDGGSTWSSAYIASGTSGTYNIVNLTAETQYSIKTRVELDDGATVTSSALSVTTYGFPRALTPPDFTLGEDVRIELFNPLSRPVLCELYVNSSVVHSQTVTGQTVSGYDASTVVDALYAKIPNSTSGTYRIRCTYAGHVDLSDPATFSVNAYACAPAFQFNALSYADTNQDSIAVTGDDQQIIRNFSVVRFSAIASGLVAKKSASIASCSVRVESQTFPLSLSSGVYSGYNRVINSAYNVNAEFVIEDSRGLKNSLDVTVTVLDWTDPSAIITLARQSNYYSETDLKADAKYSYVGGHNSLTIAYKARKTGTVPWTVSGTLTNNVTETLTLDNSFAWDVQITLTDALGAVTNYDLSVQRGLPLIFFDRLKKSVGVNCFPLDENSLEVNGVNAIRSVMSLYLASDLVLTQGGDYIRLPLSFLNSSGGKLSVDNLYGVEIGSNVHKILVSAQAVLRAGSVYGERELVIGKGSGSAGSLLSKLAYSIHTLNNTTSNAQMVSVARTLVNVNPGDQIYLYLKTPQNNTSEEVLGGLGAPTSMTIETVE